MRVSSSRNARCRVRKVPRKAMRICDDFCAATEPKPPWTAGAFEGGLLDFLAGQAFGDFAEIGGHGAGGFLGQLFVPAVEVLALAGDLGFDFECRRGGLVRWSCRFFCLLSKEAAILDLSMKPTPTTTAAMSDGQDDSEEDDGLAVEMHVDLTFERSTFKGFGHVDGHGVGGLEALGDGEIEGEGVGGFVGNDGFFGRDGFEGGVFLGADVDGDVAVAGVRG